MIRLVNGFERQLFRHEIASMHRIRADVFHKRLGWEVQVIDGEERDYFDDLNPLYLISVDEMTGAVLGSLRLLPTTGPNMLRDVFPQLLPDGLVVESATVWESSRFSMSPEAAHSDGRRISAVTSELLAGLVEVGLTAGLTHVVSVFDARMLRVLRIAGYPAELIGPPKQIGVCLTYAGLFDVSEEALAKIQAVAGRRQSVLEPDSLFRCFAAA
jgi:acyl homoserine lactone synthase